MPAMRASSFSTNVTGACATIFATWSRTSDTSPT